MMYTEQLILTEPDQDDFLNENSQKIFFWLYYINA